MQLVSFTGARLAGWSEELPPPGGSVHLTASVSDVPTADTENIHTLTLPASFNTVRFRPMT